MSYRVVVATVAAICIAVLSIVAIAVHSTRNKLRDVAKVAPNEHVVVPPADPPERIRFPSFPDLPPLPQVVAAPPADEPLPEPPVEVPVVVEPLPAPAAPVTPAPKPARAPRKMLVKKPAIPTPKPPVAAALIVLPPVKAESKPEPAHVVYYLPEKPPGTLLWAIERALGAVFPLRPFALPNNEVGG